jgi:purine-binding chemotaxis protein CheW
MKITNQFCTFYVDGYLLGVEVEKVREVVTHHQTTRVPLARPEVEGLMNQRGQVVIALDLRRRLGFSERPEGKRPMIVSVFAGTRIVNLLVDEIGDVIKTNSDQYEDVPKTLQGVGRELISGAYKFKEKLLLVLDLDKTIAIEGKKSPQPEPVHAV